MSKAVTEEIKKLRTKKKLTTVLNQLYKVTAVVKLEYGLDVAPKLKKRIIAAIKLNGVEFDYVLGILHYEFEEYEESILHYENAIRKGDLYRAHGALGAVYSYLNEYEKAIEHFGIAIAKTPEDSFVYKLRTSYNYVFTLLLSGQYKEVKKVGRRLAADFEAHSKTKEATFENFLDWGDHLQYNLSHPLDAIQIYEEALLKEKKGELRAEEDDLITLYVELVHSYRTELEKELSSDSSSAAIKRSKLLKYYLIAKSLLNEKLQSRDGGEEVTALITYEEQLAELELYKQDYESAMAIYSRLEQRSVESIGDSKADIFFFLGLCCKHLNQKKKALEYFQKSIHFKHATFVLIEYAKLLIDLDRFDEAEIQLMRATDQTKFNTDVEVLLSALYQKWGDYTKVHSTHRSNELFDKSLEFSGQVLENNQEPYYSRALTRKEILEIKYSQAYCRVELAASTKSFANRLKLYKEGKKLLEQILESDLKVMVRYKAERAISQLKKLEPVSAKTKLITKHLYITAIISSIIALILLIIGRPTDIHWGYQVDTAYTKLMEDSVRKDSGFVDNLNNLWFSSIEEAECYATKIFDKNDLNSANVKIKKWDLKIERAQLDSVAPILLLAFAILSIILAFMKDEWRKVKVGVIEIEKAELSIAQVNNELKINR